MRDLYLRTDLGNFTGSFTGAVPTHGVLALKVTPLRCAFWHICVCQLHLRYALAGRACTLIVCNALASAQVASKSIVYCFVSRKEGVCIGFCMHVRECLRVSL